MCTIILIMFLVNLKNSMKKYMQAGIMKADLWFKT